MTWRPLTPRTHSRWLLTFVRRAIGWPASPKRRAELRRAGRPPGWRGSACPCSCTRRGDRTQRRAAEESHFDVAREAMDAEEPALALDSVERRAPFDCLAHAGDGAHDECVEAAPDVPFPARHGRDVGLHGGVAVGLRDLGVAACEEGRLCDLARPQLQHRLARFGRLLDPLSGDLLCAPR